jgi:hypothetical protein
LDGQHAGSIFHRHQHNTSIRAARAASDEQLSREISKTIAALLKEQNCSEHYLNEISLEAAAPPPAYRFRVYERLKKTG